MPMWISPECCQSLAHQQENATSFVEHSFKMAGQKTVNRAKFGQSGNKGTGNSRKSVKRFSDDIMLYLLDLEKDSDFRSNRPEIIRL
ncbi:MAG: hypothetical protein E5V52_10850 [Mesorhizobium sp.]|nr:MAG: hypothetical protein E5V52_10850 [Mesorhizobium sp.]